MINSGNEGHFATKTSLCLVFKQGFVLRLLLSKSCFALEKSRIDLEVKIILILIFKYAMLFFFQTDHGQDLSVRKCK